MYHPTNAPHSSSSTRFSYQKDKRAKPGNLAESNTVSEIRQNFMESALLFNIA